MFKGFRNLFMRKTYPRVELRADGRRGHLVYMEKTREALMYWEIPNLEDYHLYVSPESLENWSDGEAVSTAEKIKVLQAFKDWLHQEKYLVQWK
jgi:hypothetical protein